MLRRPCNLGEPQQRGTKSELAASRLPSRGHNTRRNCYITAAFLGIPNKGEQNQKCCLTPPFSTAQNRVEVLRHPCILGDPQQRGTKSEVATSPLPCRGPESGLKCYVSRALSGISNKGEQNENWLPHSYLLEGRKRAEVLHYPYILGGGTAKRRKQHHKCSQTRGTK